MYLAAGDPLLQRPAAPTAAAPTRRRRRSDAPIFIDDRPTGETISHRGGDQRHAHRAAAARAAHRRAAGRRAQAPAVGASSPALVVVVVVAVLAVLGSSLFAIDDVEVEGAVYTDQAALAAVVDDLERHARAARRHRARPSATLEAIPWVEDARVTTDFPHGAKIEIRERTPVGHVRRAPTAASGSSTATAACSTCSTASPSSTCCCTSADAPDARAPASSRRRASRAAASLVEALTPELRARAAVGRRDGRRQRPAPDARPTASRSASAPARDLVAKLVRLQTWLDELDGGADQLRRRVDERGHDGVNAPFSGPDVRGWARICGLVRSLDRASGRPANHRMTT